MRLSQKIVRDTATYLGHAAGLRASQLMFGSDRPAVVTGTIATARVRQAVEDYRAGFMKTTELCRLMHGYGSDKGIGRHNYAIFYTRILEGLRNEPLAIFELGIGTNNVKLKSNMGRHGKPGASLYGWRDYLPQASIFAADIDRAILFKDERIATFYCDQTSAEAVTALWANAPLDTTAFDLIIDDGLHEFHANRNFLEHSWQKVKPGGLLIVEDILGSDRQAWYDYVKTWSQPGTNLSFIELPHPYNFVSNNIACLERL